MDEGHMTYLCLPEDVGYLMFVVAGAVFSPDCVQIGLVEFVEIAIRLVVGHVKYAEG